MEVVVFAALFVHVYFLIKSAEAKCNDGKITVNAVLKGGEGSLNPEMLVTAMRERLGYDFIWDIYCDWYIEIAKIRLNSGDKQQADNARRVLVYVLDKALKLLHPFMPFITEEIYLALPGCAETIMNEAWPEYTDELHFEKEEGDFNKIMDLIKAIRTIRADMNVHPTKRTSLIIETAELDAFNSGVEYIKKFGFATDDITVTAEYKGETSGTVQAVTHAARGFIPMAELIDKEKELARLNKELDFCDKEIATFNAKLSNEGFVSKAPAQVVDGIREKLANAEAKREKVLESLNALK